MKQIINGLTYNTETATEICTLGSGGDVSTRDFAYWSASLFVTNKGRYFMAGRGGASSVFSRPYGQNGRQGGEGIIPLEAEQALRYAEAEADFETIEKFFGGSIEDA